MTQVTESRRSLITYSIVSNVRLQMGMRKGFVRRSIVKNYGRKNELWAIDTAKQGHPAGLGFLYELHRNYVFGLCLRMTRQPSLAEDLTQDVFLHLGRKIHLYRGAAQFRSWLHRITVNMVAMYFRRHKRVDLSLENESASSIAFEFQNIPRALIRTLAFGWEKHFHPFRRSAGECCCCMILRVTITKTFLNSWESHQEQAGANSIMPE